MLFLHLAYPCLFWSGLEAVHLANVHSATAECECRTRAHSSTLSLASLPPAFQTRQKKSGRSEWGGAAAACGSGAACAVRLFFCLRGVSLPLEQSPSLPPVSLQPPTNHPTHPGMLGGGRTRIKRLSTKYSCYKYVNLDLDPPMYVNSYDLPY